MKSARITLDINDICLEMSGSMRHQCLALGVCEHDCCCVVFMLQNKQLRWEEKRGEAKRGGRTWFDRLQADRLPKVADDSQGVAVCKSTDRRPVHLQQHVPVVGQLPDVTHQHVQLHLAEVGELSQLCSSQNLHHGAEVPQVPPWHRALHHLAGPVFLLLQRPGHGYSLIYLFIYLFFVLPPTTILEIGLVAVASARCC